MRRQLKLLVFSILLIFTSSACFLFNGLSSTDLLTNIRAVSTSTGNTLAIPYESVVLVIAAYYDQNGDLQPGWTGSGTIISEEGLILTNAHVVLSSPYFQVDEVFVAVTVSEDREPELRYIAEVVQADEALDIAIIRVSTDLDGNSLRNLHLQAVPIGDSDQLNLGDPITILGYPGIGGVNITLTRGQVSGFTGEEDREDPRAFIKTDATIAGGNRGGLAADENGYLIGVPTQLGYGGSDQFVDCRVLVDTNGDGKIDEADNCVPTGGFINALRPIKLALPLIEAARQGEVRIERSEQVVVNTPTQAPSSTPDLTQTPEAETQDVIFRDDFSDSNSGLSKNYTNDQQSNYYAGGEFFIEVYDGTHKAFDIYPQSRDDVVVEADIRFANKIGDGGAALVCRQQEDSSSLYNFEVNESGYYSIYKHENGEWIALVDWTYSIFVAQNVATQFHLTVTCEGHYLSLALNGRLLAETSDESLASGGVGVSATTISNPNLAVAFDNFIVRKPANTIPTDGLVLYTNHFNRERPDLEIEGEEYNTHFDGAEFFIEIHVPHKTIWHRFGLDLTDSVASIEVRFDQPAGNGKAALMCRLTEDDKHYRFVIAADGHYGIDLYDGSKFIPLMDWRFSEYVLANIDSFTMSVVCDGDHLVMGMDGHVLADIFDDTLSSGEPAILGGTSATPGLIVAFDNYSVREVEER